jgi:hypothetical protein
MNITGWHKYSDPADDDACVMISGQKGTSATTMGAGETLLSVCNLNDAMARFRGNGDLEIAGTVYAARFRSNVQTVTFTANNQVQTVVPTSNVMRVNTEYTGNVLILDGGANGDTLTIIASRSNASTVGVESTGSDQSTELYGVLLAGCFATNSWIF